MSIDRGSLREDDSDNWGDDQKAGVREAFVKWTDANALSGLNTSFTEASGDTAEIVLKRTEQANTQPGVSRPFPQPLPMDGIGETGEIEFNKNTSLLMSRTGYLKVALHEIGHLLGLGNATGTSGTSVMNQFGIVNEPNVAPIMRMDDYRRNIATDVRKCDRMKALGASVRPWP